MKQTTRTLMAILAIASLVFWTSCSKTDRTELKTTEESISASSSSSDLSTTSMFMSRTEVPSSSVPALCGTVMVKNFIKNSYTYGSIQVGNDATDYYITISSNTGCSLKDIRLYVGTESGIPVNAGNGQPKHNEYPVQKSFSTPCPNTWTLKIPIAELGNSFWVSTRTSFVDPSNAVQAIWSEGITFPPSNNGSKFQYEIQTCIIDEGCAYGQGYWFGMGNQSWPDVNGATEGHITIGGENYTRDQARAIWWANNGNCPGIPNAKKAFAFVAAIKLSGSSVIGNAGLWEDLTMVDNWLETLERLSETNICDHPSAPANVRDAIAGLGAWMDEHDCE